MRMSFPIRRVVHRDGSTTSTLCAVAAEAAYIAAATAAGVVGLHILGSLGGKVKQTR